MRFLKSKASKLRRWFQVFTKTKADIEAEKILEEIKKNST